MKALVIADRPPQKRISEYLSENSIDIIITLGDLTLLDIRELEEIHNIPKIGVYGNHDSGNYMETLGIQNMHMKSIEFMGFRIAGFEGSVRYKESDHAAMYTQEQASSLLKFLPGCDILIAHSPPFGIHDHEDPPHVGLKGLRDYLDAHSPKYMLHGHTYPDESEK